MTSHICLAWRGLGIRQQSGWKEQMDKETEIHSAHSSTNISSSFKIPHSIIFYSKVDSNYRLFPQAEWMCNFLHLLGSWQFDNHRTATAVLPTKVLPLRQCLLFFLLVKLVLTHTSVILFFSFSSCIFLIIAFLLFLPSKARISLKMPIFTYSR